MDGNDIMLRKVGAKAKIRLQDIDDMEIIRILQDPNNIIKSNGTDILVNGRNIFENAESIRSTRRLVTQRLIKSTVGPAVEGRNRMNFIRFDGGDAILQGDNG